MHIVHTVTAAVLALALGACSHASSEIHDPVMGRMVVTDLSTENRSHLITCPISRGSNGKDYIKQKDCMASSGNSVGHDFLTAVTAGISLCHWSPSIWGM